jgi:germination protein YpeB
MKKSQSIIISILLLTVFGLSYYVYFLNNKADNNLRNTYDYSFSELVTNVNNIENYLAKAMISKSSTHSADTLTKIWSDSNLAIAYMKNIPFDTKGSNNSIKFLNQLSDYSYSLSRKCIKGEELNDTDFENLKKMYQYALDLKNTVNQMAYELDVGEISWNDLDSSKKLAFDEKENLNIFSNIESNFDDYEGLIYDGAYSDYIVKENKLGLVGENISKDDAKSKIQELFKDENVEKCEYIGDINGDIESYIFEVRVKDRNQKMEIEVSKKGGWIVEIIENRDVLEEKISNEDAINKGKEFLEKIGYQNMKETYSLKEANIVTINYAYEEDGVLMYPDLIKVKVALDDGEILGMEALGYLNAHTNRNLTKNVITSEQAKGSLSDSIVIENVRLSVIPLDNKQESYCYEFKGKVEEKEFLVYINAETGEEEEILILLETPGGILTI